MNQKNKKNIYHCKYKCSFDGRKCNSNQKWNNTKCTCERNNLKEHNTYEKHYVWNPLPCSSENGKYLGSIVDNSLITCDEVIDTTKIVPAKTIPTNFN